MSPLFRDVAGRAGLAVLVVALCVGPALAQIPDEFTNLKVLPKDISKQELVEIMKSFSGALGVRCNFCHVPGPTPGTLEGFDFASDKPEHKETARGMMKMVHQINATLIPESGLEHAEQVRCITCHRGVESPEPLETLLLEEIDEKGIPAAETRYRELRDEYYGSGSYDFGPMTLTSVASTLSREKHDTEGAIVIAKLNLEFYPDDVSTLVMLGQMYASQGNSDDAVKSLEKALELEPDNRWAKQTLEKVRSGQ
jgi:tetratricopeptide (TPR) repeat protein